ncbi:hypothetical protein IQ254_27810 [Nodosilinea sp. LEGE 07088]|uniref:hypothetical protein n=1 Tax=Nodosilinea sp. LEGE 07088 TaxID=2777968 RepID=UPI001882EEF6|nr:hypothetical protein [Nodosilinea sp. LEGE 07088]MBE9140961.1 hypothetical protein [Nodosilinea sp. LEGE 07088]
MEVPHAGVGGSIDVKVEPFKRPVRLSLGLDQDSVGDFSFQIAPASDSDQEVTPYLSLSIVGDQQHVSAQVSWPEWEDFIGSGDESTSILDLGKLIAALL